MDSAERVHAIGTGDPDERWEDVAGRARARRIAEGVAKGPDDIVAVQDPVRAPARRPILQVVCAQQVQAWVR